MFLAINIYEQHIFTKNYNRKIVQIISQVKEDYPDLDGIDFDLEIAREILKENKDEYTIPLKITKANKTINDLGTEAFPYLISSFSTKYDASNKNRSTNLEIAAQKINGKVLMPGEIFSYNKVVGARTIEAGYKEAGAYSGGGVVQSVGGGICQIWCKNRVFDPYRRN